LFIFFCFIIDILKRMVEDALIYDNVNVVVVDWVSGKPNRHPVIIICREKTVVFCASLLLLLLCFLVFFFFLPHHNNKRFWATVHTSCGQYSIDWCYVGSPSSLFTRENFKSTSMSKRQISYLFKHFLFSIVFQSQFQVPTENCHIAGHSLGILR